MTLHAQDVAVKEILVYSPYGALTGALMHFSIYFNGEALDGACKGYHLGRGKRLYLPGLMRFVSPDVLSPFSSGGLNVYAYCSGDPVNYTDPSGMTPMKPSRTIPTLKQQARKVLKKQGVITKGQAMIDGTIPLGPWEGPSPKSNELRDKYFELRNSRMPPSRILEQHPELKSYVKRNSRTEVIDRLFDGGGTRGLKLPKHLALQERAMAPIEEYRMRINMSFTSALQHSEVIASGAIAFGLSKSDSAKLISWIRKLD